MHINAVWYHEEGEEGKEEEEAEDGKMHNSSKIMKLSVVPLNN